MKVPDQTNADTRVKMHEVLGERMHDRLLAASNAIGHNKFVVYLDPAGKPRAVTTGSTNWTPTGLAGQSNNALLMTPF